MYIERFLKFERIEVRFSGNLVCCTLIISTQVHSAMKFCLSIILVIFILALASAFRPTTSRESRGSFLFSTTNEADCWREARPVHSKLEVTRATEDELREMNVKEWPIWTTEGSPKYIVGKKAPVKVYDTNELSYIINGSMKIWDTETGVATLVEAGDFITFPRGCSVQWEVLETITKHWFCYKNDGSPDLD